MKLNSCIESVDEYGRSGWLIQFPYNAEFIDEFKGVINYHHRQWNADTLTWWVDEIYAQTLEQLFDNWTFPIIKDTQKTTGCPKCNGTGLLPFVKRDGKVSSYAKIFCECHEEHEYYHRLTPEMFDFPMSYDFRSFIEEQCTGKPLPPIDPEDETTEVHYVDTEWSNKQWDTIKQLKADNVHLRTQWYKHLKEDREYRASKRKPKSKWD